MIEITSDKISEEVLLDLILETLDNLNVIYTINVAHKDNSWTYQKTKAAIFKENNKPLCQVSLNKESF